MFGYRSITLKVKKMKKLMVIGSLLFSLMLTFESCKTVVATRPEQPAVVARPPQPHPNYVWVDGEWYVSGGRYVWREGYWSAPRGGSAWAPGHWEQTRKGWYWVKGHWR